MACTCGSEASTGVHRIDRRRHSQRFTLADDGAVETRDGFAIAYTWS
ncbi:hypothetical protein GGR33_000638 [Methylobacterium brachythecii]|uniref:Uncharacterized protein n=1 Tax=Methylobacterium brachythecii TaxID=1176177 RepID=A0A7W6F5C0_9HYPH|nr:hypothetical protein [Methylobacterium brachythecii]